MGFLVDRCPHCRRWIQARSGDQNERFHAICGDIARQKQWAGMWLDTEDWKRLLVAAWERTQDYSVKVLPALDGQGIDVIYRRTSRLSKQEMSELTEFATAWAVDNGVKLREPDPARHEF